MAATVKRPSGRDESRVNRTPTPQREKPAFAEEALRLSGKSDEEVRRVGAVDAADERVEELFAATFQTAASPLHRAVWDHTVAVDLFRAPRGRASAEANRVMQEALEVLLRRRDTATLYDQDRKIGEDVLDELGQVGYWGVLVDRQYGGQGASFSQFASWLSKIATVDPTVAGLASVHGCIGAVDPVQTFGTRRQKEQFLPELASGRRLSGFALTEPCAGSDLTALRTTARRDGDYYLVSGEKLFITNVRPGRTIGLVCLIDQRPSVLIVDLPDREDVHFRLTSYGLYALKHTHNRGIIFNNFPVPAENLLEPVRGDGLAIAYHGLNRGRVSLCATAAGTMRVMLAEMIPWARFRRTYGAPIAARELVRRRLGYLAGLIVSCDALTEWCAGLLDRGYRGEMECIVAKVFSSESQKEAAIELLMKTHGGRAFLHGHYFGDNVHEFLAPCIYEGEGDMLGLGLFKSLVKHHAQKYFQPIGKALAAADVRHPKLTNPAHLWLLKGPLWSYAKWFLGEKLRRHSKPSLPPMPPELERHAQFAADRLGRFSLEISTVLRKHQLKLADHQCRMVEISRQVQTATVILATSLFAAAGPDDVVRRAADCICRELTGRLTGRRPSDGDFRALDELGAAIADGHFNSISHVTPEGILMPYQP